MAAGEAAPLTDAEVAPLLDPCLTGQGAVLAVSGGPDSMALMGLAAALRRGSPLLVATVDHGLRPESGAEARTVAAWAGEAGLPHRILVWAGEKPRSRIQEAARAARYGLLAALAREVGAARILTAHTRDDQAETVLMRLLRGSGPAGLAGMRPEAPLAGCALARPFLGLPKARLVATCRARGWPFVEDPSNRDPRFTRARLRALLPALEGEGLTPGRLALLAVRQRRAEEALAAMAEVAAARLIRAAEPGRLVLDAPGLLAEPDEIALRVVLAAIRRLVPGAAPRLERLEAFLEALRRGGGGGRFAATLGGVEARLDGTGHLVLRRERPRRGTPGP